MNTSKFSLTSGAALLALLATLVAGTASAQTYTVKVGAGYIDPRATSSDLQGSMPSGASVPSGLQLQVQPQSALLFSIARSFNEHWEAELVLGFPPTHDVKLRVNNPQLAAGAAAYKAGTITAATAGAAHIESYNDQVVATVKQIAPTAFINYRFREASSAFRPYVGVGINYTHMKADANDLGTSFYNDGPVRIQLSDSFGLAFQAGVNYKLDKNWSLNASWATAAVSNHITINTNNSQQDANYRIHPSVFSVMVGYTY
ncbi:MAG: outer membrane beta-barrel protein [Burkholderiales bacterium]|nr:outer membrane beta-barrel protein [Burkholderiales bacterium]